MAEPISQQEFSEQHQTLAADLKEAVHKSGFETNCPAQNALQKETEDVLAKVVGDLSKGGDLDPKAVLRNGLGALTALDAREFLIANVLESVKGGKSLTKTLAEYKDLGLTSVVVSERPDPKLASVKTRPKNGEFLWGLDQKVKKFIAKVYRVIINAMRAIADMCEIKPVIGFVGTFPSLSFQMEIGNISVMEFLEIFTGTKEKKA